MKNCRLSWGLVAVLTIVVAVFAYKFTVGNVAPSDDGRQAVLLTKAERNALLLEMRTWLQSSQAVLAAAAAKDFDTVVTSAGHLKQVFPGGTWPDGLTLEEDLIRPLLVGSAERAPRLTPPQLEDRTQHAALRLGAHVLRLRDGEARSLAQPPRPGAGNQQRRAGGYALRGADARSDKPRWVDSPGDD